LTHARHHILSDPAVKHDPLASAHASLATHVFAAAYGKSWMRVVPYVTDEQRGSDG